MSVAVPFSITVCDFEASLSLIVRVPVRLPTAVGVKTTAIEHFILGAILVQLSVCEKSPLITTLETTRVVLPLFWIVTFCALDLMVTSWALNVNVFGETAATGGGPAIIVNINDACWFAGFETTI